MLELDLVQHNFYLKFNTCCMAWYSACACHFPLCFCLLRSMSPLFNYCLIKHYFTARTRIFKAIASIAKYLWFRCFFNFWTGGFRSDYQESISLSSKLFTRNSAASSVVHNLAMFWKIKYETLFLETFAYYHGFLENL